MTKTMVIGSTIEDLGKCWGFHWLAENTEGMTMVDNHVEKKFSEASIQNYNNRKADIKKHFAK